MGFGEVEGIRAFCLGVWDGMGWDGRGGGYQHGVLSTMMLGV